MLKLTEEEQRNIIKYVSETCTAYDDLLRDWKERMLNIDDNCKTFKSPKGKAWHTTFKVNKCHEIENKVTPRIISNNPKWIVTPASDEFDTGDIDLSPEERTAKTQKYSEYTIAIRDYLSSVFKKGDIKEVIRLGAKNLVRHGVNRWKVTYKYDVSREKYNKVAKQVDEEGNEMEVVEKKTKEKVVNEYPTIEVKNWVNMLYDPRYIRLENMPCIVDVNERVRMSFFTQNESKYMNIDKLRDYCSCGEIMDDKGYAHKIYAITGIMPELDIPVDKNNLSVKKAYFYYELGDEIDAVGKKEGLYECWIVNDQVMVYADEITCMPFEDVKCFIDTETHLATGFIEPILGLQDELNFKKNSASEYINQSLNRNWVWSPNSGVNPKHLVSSPGNIIPTTKSAEEAMRNLVELPMRQLPPQYFQEQNDFERQIQASTFTIDTASHDTSQALTNTATGMKIKMYESNIVINEIREAFEDSLARIAYKLLEETFNNLDDNIIIKKLDGEGFWEINKEAMRDAIRRYDIRIETGSSSYDGIEQRRADAIAQWNIAQQGKAAGVNVDLDETFKQLMGTFERVDITKLIKPSIPQPMAPSMMDAMPQKPIAMPQQNTGGIRAELPFSAPSL